MRCADADGPSHLLAVAEGNHDRVTCRVMIVESWSSHGRKKKVLFLWRAVCFLSDILVPCSEI